jgi:hypothetical protein
MKGGHMPRIMYDSTDASRIKANLRDPAMVAGYIDAYSIPAWTDKDWNTFPNAVKVRIAKKASTNAGHVLDVEPKLATPAQAPVWARMRRSSGFPHPCIYVQKSTWGQVQQAFRAANEPQPLYWIAHYNGVKELPVLNGIRAIAKQYLGDTNGMDYSYVDDYWPGVDVAPGPIAKKEVDEMTDVAPMALPYSGGEAHAGNDDYAQVAYPIEVGSNSSLIAAQWVSIFGAWGDTDYELICIGKNQTLVAPAGVFPASTPTVGKIKDRQRFLFQLPDGCEGIALRYRNNGSWSRLGISFPQRSK